MIELIISGTEADSDHVSIDKDKITIGRAGDNDVVLPSFEVSRYHAEILKRNGDWTLSDLNTTNGTFIGGKRVETEENLQIGEIFSIGNFELRLVEKEKKSVQELKREVHNKLLKKTELRNLDFNKVEENNLRGKIRKIIEDIIKENNLEIHSITTEEFISEVLDETLGLGPLEDLINDPEITEIMVNGKDRIYVERHGKLSLYPRKFSSDAQVLAVIERIVAPLGRHIDESSPLVDARLKDGSRVNAIIPPLSISGPALTIRKFSPNLLSVKDLIHSGSLTKEIAEFLKMCVLSKRNILISGGTGTGKTTLLNLISGFLPNEERIITIEDAAELKLSQEHVVRLEARPTNIEGRGEITIRDLVRNALRMRPDRIIVGECRGGETLDMLQAMNTGHDGSCTTVHANSCRDSLLRLETMVLMSGMDLPVSAIREQIASAIHIILQLSRFSNGERKIVKVAEVRGIDRGSISIDDIFTFEHKAGGVGKFIPTGTVPGFVKELEEHGLEVNMEIFK